MNTADTALPGTRRASCGLFGSAFRFSTFSFSISITPEFHILSLIWKKLSTPEKTLVPSASFISLNSKT